MVVRRQLGEELDQLTERILFMGGLVESAVQKGLRAALERQPGLAQSVIGEIEPEINALELEIDRRALDLMALQQPMAVDLRFVAAALKISNDLERMGDLAVNIAEGTPRLLSQSHNLPAVDLPLMSRLSTQMLRSALDALVRRDSGLARQVLVSDDQVDTMRDEIFDELMRAMARTPERIEACVALMFLARNLERIADHATNIAEDVIFWVEGVDVRHHSAEAPGAAH
ncbi:MAG TPA: phosphate signaling complex protein PhoU [Terriglobales bacterium]|nr:phosphate signaling complex protein PhoU [Terriglobales bacterium]